MKFMPLKFFVLCLFGFLGMFISFKALLARLENLIFLNLYIFIYLSLRKILIKILV